MFDILTRSRAVRAPGESLVPYSVDLIVASAQAEKVLQGLNDWWAPRALELVHGWGKKAGENRRFRAKGTLEVDVGRGDARNTLRSVLDKEAEIMRVILAIDPRAEVHAHLETAE